MPHLVKVLLLALIQGFSEFLPISSSGHLVIGQALLHFNTHPLLYDIFFHLGTLASVCFFFFPDLKNMLLKFREKENLRLWLMLVLASVPTGLIALFFKDFLESLFTRPNLVGYSLLITALFLFLSRHLKVKIMNPYLAALIIGTFQGLAIVPGISRSGLTISVALILGLGFELSFRFSFILSIPAILGALVFEWKGLPPLDGELFPLIFGFIIAAVVGLLSLSLLKKIMLKEHFHWFGYYCLAAGTAALILI